MVVGFDRREAANGGQAMRRRSRALGAKQTSGSESRALTSAKVKKAGFVPAFLNSPVSRVSQKTPMTIAPRNTKTKPTVRSCNSRTMVMLSLLRHRVILPEPESLSKSKSPLQRKISSNLSQIGSFSESRNFLMDRKLCRNFGLLAHIAAHETVRVLLPVGVMVRLPLSHN